MAKSKPRGSLASLRRTTDLLSALLAGEASALHSRCTGEGGGEIKALKEITAVLKDLAAVAKMLNEQESGTEGSECGVILLPPVQEEDGS